MFGIMRFMDCCSGQCKSCDRYIDGNLEKHMKECMELSESSDSAKLYEDLLY